MSTFIEISTPLHGLFISPLNNRFMRCDLHVHSTASGMCNTPLLNQICRESYNQPEEVYSRLKQLGMSLITLTDHDSIDAAEALRKHADFFLSEEATVQLPTGTEMHMGVYGMTERDHMEIQRRRNDFISLVMYLTERRLFFSANHVFSGLTGRRERRDFEWFASCVPAVESRNGQMWRKSNESASKLAVRLGKIAIAGSDSHTLAGVGLTYTEVPGARTAAEFFAGLRCGKGIVCGAHGSYLKLTLDVFRIVFAMVSEESWTLLLTPLALFVPACVAGHWLNEIRFWRKWASLVERGERGRLLQQMDSNFEASWASMG